MNNNNNSISLSLLLFWWTKKIWIICIVCWMITTTITIPIISTTLTNHNNNIHFFVVNGLEAKWTPNENDNQKDGTGPLPLSLKQRQQLTQLDQTIQKSPNPQETLNHIAKQNQMDPTELMNMLQRNRNDMSPSGMQQQSSSSQFSTIPLMIVSFIYKIIRFIPILIIQYYKLYPKLCSISIILIILSIYTTRQIPYSGIMISNQNNQMLISKGPTTLFIPSNTFIHEYYTSSFLYNHRINHIWNNNKNKDIKKKKNKDNYNEDILSLFQQLQLNNDNSSDGMMWHSTSSSSKSNNNDNQKINIDLALTSQGTIYANDFLLWDDDDDDKQVVKSNILQYPKKKHNNNNNDDTVNEIITILYENSKKILYNTFDITEYIPLSSDNDVDIDDYYPYTNNQDEAENGDDDSQVNNNGRYIPPIRKVDYMKLIPIVVNDKRINKDINKKIDNNDSSNNNISDFVVFIMKGLGDYKRYGLIPFQMIRNNNKNKNMISLTLDSIPFQQYTSLNGQIIITIEKKGFKNIMNNKNDDHKEEEPVLVVRVHYVQLKGKQYTQLTNTNIIEQLIYGIQYSIMKSIKLYTMMSLQRKYQSYQYHANTKSRAGNKRHTRFMHEKELNEMSIDRRRRWQNKNINSGSYRPSFDRMKSPKNAIMYS